MQKNNIVLIGLYDIGSFPVRTLHAVLKKARVNVNSIFFKDLNRNTTMDPPTDNEIACLVKLIKELEPAFVGISVRSSLFKLASRITKEIKRELDTLVIWGGIHPTIRPYQCLEFADSVCIGEGEEAVKELAIRLSRGEEIDNIQNLWIKKGDKIIENDLRPLIQDLDTILFPDFSDGNKYFVQNGDVLPLPSPQQRTSYWIMSSRGCPFNCTYCCNKTLRMTYRGKGEYVRRRGVENVIEELGHAKRRFENLAFISFLDDVFTFDIDWIKKFCSQYKDTVNMPFFCCCHPKATDEEMIRLLKDAGVSGMVMGIQTGSEEIRRKYYERHDTNEEIVRAAEILHKYKIRCTYDIIMDNPLETEKDRSETLGLLLRLPRPFGLNIFSLIYYPETKLTNLLLEKRIISENDIEDQRQKACTRWEPTLDLKRDKENLFWDVLYYLAKSRYIPKGIIVWLSRVNFLKNHPLPLSLLLRSTSTNIYTVRRGSRIDMMRWYLMSIICKPRLLFKKRAWLFLWGRIKEKGSSAFKK